MFAERMHCFHVVPGTTCKQRRRLPPRPPPTIIPRGDGRSGDSFCRGRGWAPASGAQPLRPSPQQSALPFPAIEPLLPIYGLDRPLISTPKHGPSIDRTFHFSQKMTNKHPSILTVLVALAPGHYCCVGRLQALLAPTGYLSRPREKIP